MCLKSDIAHYTSFNVTLSIVHSISFVTRRHEAIDGKLYPDSWNWCARRDIYLRCPNLTYTLLFTGSTQRLWYLYHRLGIWSNVIVSAHYSNKAGISLTKDAIIDALRLVVAAHPALWQVFVQRPSAAKGHHSLHTAVLHTMDLEKCIECLDGVDSVDRITSDVLEEAHNEWLWTADEPDKPWWKLLVKGHDIAFVYHHSVGDGVSGMVFHREFLAALNSLSTIKSIRFDKARQSTVVNAGEANDVSHIAREPENVWEGTNNILEGIWTIFIWLFLKVYYGKARLFGNLPPSRPYLKSATAVADPQQRTVTRIISHRISASDMAKILDGCRAQHTTFTPLLLTMFLIVLSTEFYPDAKIGATRFNFDLRPTMPMSRIGGGTANGTIFNCAASWQSWHRLGPYRRAVSPLSDKTDSSLDTEGIWDLVRQCKRDMALAMSGKALRMWIGLKHMGSDLEDLVRKAFPSISLMLKPTFSVSNIGTFSDNSVNGDGVIPGSWHIHDMQFSAGAVNGNQGSHGVVFHVAGVSGGDTVINASCEDGIVPKEIAERLLKRTVARMIELTV